MVEERYFSSTLVELPLFTSSFKEVFCILLNFSKDYAFGESDMENIIFLWMAEGLLTLEHKERMEDVGKAYLQALVSRSFFQQLSTRWGSALVMHDLVHDLAMFISGEFCFSCGDSNDLSNLGTKSCHLSYRKGRVDLMKLGVVSQSREKKLMSLHTLLALPLSLVCQFEFASYYHLDDKPILELHELFLKVGGCLRVLSDSIGNMKYLRYLDLSHTKIKELPDSICTLYNLQTLLLLRCYSLERLPTKLSALVKLRHLNIQQTHIKELPPQTCKLKSLETLSYFVLGENDGWRIKELGELPLLGGSLCISRLSWLEHIVDVKDVLEANLKDKKFLSELILECGWCGDSNITSSQQEREVFEALQPHTNLKQIIITGYRGTIFLDWVGHESFCNMVQVVLYDCGNMCMLPPLGQLSSLRRLTISALRRVVSIGNEFCGTTIDHPFTSLEKLNISIMTSWKEWSFSSNLLGQEGRVFPSLTELSIRNCKKLIVGLPDCHLPSLKSIEIGFCDEIVGVFVCQSHQEMENNAFPSLKSLAISEYKKLWENRMKWGLERLPSLMKLSLWGRGIEEEVDSFLGEGLLPTTLTKLSIEEFEKLKGLNGRAFQHLTSLQNLEIGYCRELKCLPQEGLPLSLSCLSIYQCLEVLKQRCQGGTWEDWPKIQHIPKIHIW